MKKKLFVYYQGSIFVKIYKVGSGRHLLRSDTKPTRIDPGVIFGFFLKGGLAYGLRVLGWGKIGLDLGSIPNYTQSLDSRMIMNSNNPR